MTVFEAYNDLKHKLKAAEIEDYVFEAKQIIKYVTKYNAAEILSHYNEELSLMQRTIMKSLVEQRLKRYPLQYLIGKWSFYGLDFYVGEGVLVPRADTETLVDAAFEFLKEHETARVLDLCAGTGCIGITVAKRFPKTKVTGIEKYDTAFSYFEKNVVLNKVDNMTPVKADIYEYVPEGEYDLILSNPPYVTAAEMDTVDIETSKEPETALYGGEDGLDFYRIIGVRYVPHLKDGGKLMVEIGKGHDAEVAALMNEAGLSDITFAEDLSGIKRVVIGTQKKVK